MDWVAAVVSKVDEVSLGVELDANPVTRRVLVDSDAAFTEQPDVLVVVVKSAQHFYNGFVGLAKEILYVASPGAADPDVTRWPYTKRKTPFWPKVADPWK